MRAGIVLAAAAAIAGCGGGDGGGGNGGTGSAGAAAPTPKSTALAESVPPANFDFANYERTRPLLSSEFVPDPGRFADAGRTYVAIWGVDAGGERLPLAFLRLQALQALDRQGGLRLDLPRSVAVVGFEVYDRNGPSTSLTGEIRR
jgi:hypothetical protein